MIVLFLALGWSKPNKIQPSNTCNEHRSSYRRDKNPNLGPCCFEGLWPYFGLHLRLRHGYSTYSDQKNCSHNYDLEAYHCSEFDISIDELYYLELVVSLKSPPYYSFSASQRNYPPTSFLDPTISYLGSPS